MKRKSRQTFSFSVFASAFVNRLFNLNSLQCAVIERVIIPFHDLCYVDVQSRIIRLQCSHNYRRDLITKKKSQVDDYLVLQIFFNKSMIL